MVTNFALAWRAQVVLSPSINPGSAPGVRREWNLIGLGFRPSDGSKQGGFTERVRLPLGFSLLLVVV